MSIRLLIPLALGALFVSPVGAQTFTGQLAPGDQQLESGEYVDWYTVEAEPGQTLTLDLRSTSALDPYLLLRGPSGQEVDNDDHEGDRTHSRIVHTVIPGGGGTFQIGATSYQPGEKGSYTLTASVAGSSEPLTEGPPAAPDEEVFVVVDEMPELVGGLESVRPDYPEEARLAGVEGRVFLQFIVRPDGAVSDVAVIRGVHPLLDAAAVAAIEGARFRPGRQDGRPVPVQFSLPINFRLETDSESGGNGARGDGASDDVDLLLLTEGGEADTTEFEVDDDAVWLPVVAQWEVGERRTLRVEAVKTVRPTGEPAVSDTTVTVYDVEVAEWTDEGGYLVRWMPRGGSEDEPLPLALDAGLVERLGREGFLLRLDEGGAFEGVENAADIRALTGAIVDSLTAADPEFAERGRAFLDMMRSDDAITQILLAPATAYYALHGREYKLQAKDTYAGELPTALGEPIPITETLTSRDFDEEAGTFAVELTQVVDPAVYRALIRRMAEMAGATAERLAELDDLEWSFRTRRRVIVEAWTGWVRALTLEREAAGLEGRHVERMTIHTVGASLPSQK